MLNLRKPLNLALLCYMDAVWVLLEVALVLLFGLLDAGPVAWRAHRHRHGVRHYQAMTRGHLLRRLDSDSTGDKTGEDDGEDGSVNEKFHDRLPPGGFISFKLEDGDNREYSSRI
jgi:hypothetical protein